MDRSALLADYPVNSSSYAPPSASSVYPAQPQPPLHVEPSAPLYQPVVPAVAQPTVAANEVIVHRAFASHSWFRTADEFAVDYHLTQLPPFIAAGEWAHTIHRVNGALKWPNGAVYAHSLLLFGGLALIAFTVAVFLIDSFLLGTWISGLIAAVTSGVLKRQQIRYAVVRANHILAGDNEYYATPRPGKLPCRVSVDWEKNRPGCGGYAMQIIVTTTASAVAHEPVDVAALQQQQYNLYHHRQQQQQQQPQQQQQSPPPFYYSQQQEAAMSVQQPTYTSSMPSAAGVRQYPVL